MQAALKQFHVLRTDYKLLLLKASLKLVTMVIPPLSIHAPYHHFEDNHVIPLGLSFVLPQTFRWRTHIGRDATKRSTSASRSVEYISAAKRLPLLS